MEKRAGMPSWVYWGLWGMNSRKVAFGFFVASVILTLIIVPLGIYIQDYVTLSVIGVPIWYWFSIKWADDNAAWITAKTS